MKPEIITATDLTFLADMAEVLEHSVDEERPPPGKEWCYFGGPAVAGEMRALIRKLSTLRAALASRASGTGEERP